MPPLMNRSARPRGFTLTELAAVLAVVAILATSGLASFATQRERRLVEGVSRELAADLMFIRAEALGRSRNLRLSFYVSEHGSCYLIHTGAREDCRCDDEAPAVCEPTAEALKGVFLPAAQGIAVRANRASLTYSPTYGTTSPTATVQVLGPGGLAVQHRINILGRARTCSPGAALPGHVDCAQL